MVTEIVDLVFPANCLGCGRPGAAWCAWCQPASRPGSVGRPNGPPVYAAGEYAEQLRTALIGYKERHRRQLAAPLAGYLADAADCALRAGGTPGSSVLVPVPSSRAAARSRGGDHMWRLARAVGRQLGLPVVRAVRLSGPVTDSAGLSAEQRRLNLAGRMVAGPPPGGDRPRPILLDDIVTTGATLAEAARALAVAGWPPGAAAVIAATRLRSAAAGPASRAPPWRIAGSRTGESCRARPARTKSGLLQLGRLAIRV